MESVNTSEDSVEDESLRELMREYHKDGSVSEVLPTPSDPEVTLKIALNALRKQGYGSKDLSVDSK